MKQGTLIGLVAGLAIAFLAGRAGGGAVERLRPGDTMIGLNEGMPVGQAYAPQESPAGAFAPMPVAEGAVPPGAMPMPPSETGSGWIAEGLCQPAPVTTELIRMVFDPNMVGAPEGGTPPLDVQEQANGVVFGDYRVMIDPGSRTVEVTGPEGAEFLKRDIDNCVAPVGEMAAGGETGVWRWSDAAGSWRYVNEIVEPMELPDAPPDPSA